MWQLIETVLQGFVFFIIGDQLAATVRHVSAHPDLAIGLSVGANVGSVLIMRAPSIWLGNRAPFRRTRLGLEETSSRALEKNDSVVLWWSQSRGVITLAAACSIPATAAGNHFPDRRLLLFCAQLLVLFTLLVQGTTLSVVARAMHLPGNGPNARRQPSEDRLAALERTDGVEPGETRGQVRRRLRAAMIDADREELLRWRDTGRPPDRNLRHLQRELDYEETMLRTAADWRCPGRANALPPGDPDGRALPATAVVSLRPPSAWPRRATSGTPRTRRPGGCATDRARSATA